MAYETDSFGEILSSFAEANIPLHDGSEKSRPTTVRLPEYPKDLIDKAFDNEAAHPLLQMAHIDKHGNPFISIMGFSYIDGKVHITSRSNAFKIKRLQDNPRCSMCYHNNIPRPHLLGCITLVGKAVISHDEARIRQANEILSHKTYRDGDDDVDARGPMIESMHEADRTLIILDEIEAVYIISPMIKGLPAGIPTPVVAWRADYNK